MGNGVKPIGIVVLESISIVTIVTASTIGLVAHAISSDAVTMIWGAALGYAFKNGYQYVPGFKSPNGGGGHGQEDQQA